MIIMMVVVVVVLVVVVILCCFAEAGCEDWWLVPAYDVDAFVVEVEVRLDKGRRKSLCHGVDQQKVTQTTAKRLFLTSAARFMPPQRWRWSSSSIHLRRCRLRRCTQPSATVQLLARSAKCG